MSPLLEHGEEERRFGILTKGELDKQKLRKLGLKQLPSMKQINDGDTTEEQVRWCLEVEAWTMAIIGSADNAGQELILPQLDTLSGHDFIKDKEGHYAEIREEKMVIMQQKLEMKNQNGETIYVSRPPVELDPKFFTALKKHVTLSAARKIMKYIMEVCNETMKHAEQAVCATSFELASEQLRFPNRFCCAPSLYAHPEAPRL
jgi:hypothetical protein